MNNPGGPPKPVESAAFGHASEVLSEPELRALLAASDDLVAVLDADALVRKMVVPDPAALCVPGLREGATVEELFGDLAGRVCRRIVRRALQADHTLVREYRLRTPRGDRWFVARIRGLADGRNVVWIARDVTEHRATTRALERRYDIERQLGRLSRRFINIPPDLIDRAIDDALAEMGASFGVERAYIYQMLDDGRVMLNSHGWRKPGVPCRLGYRKPVPTADFPWLTARLQAGEVIQVASLDTLPCQAASERAVLAARSVGSLVLVPVRFSGQVNGFIGFDSFEPGRSWGTDQVDFLRAAGETFAGALQRRHSEDKIYRLAYYDKLTGLPNRALLHAQLKRRLRQNRPLRLAIIDLDESSTLNDLLGHDVGDLLLKAVGSRLGDLVGPGEILGRWGADEFLLGLNGAAERLDRVRDCLEAPFVIEGKELGVSCCTGVASFPDDARHVSPLLGAAEMALHQAKQQGSGNCCRYSRALKETAARRSELRGRLRRALERDELAVHYQPLVCAADGMIVGAEALLRWNDPELGPIPPDQFIPIAEQSGLIGSLGEWVLRRACQDLRGWPVRNGVAPRLSVNVSGLQLVDDRLSDALGQLVGERGLDADQLELEITESALMERGQAGLPLLQRLRELGIGVAVDDFGTGYSSLSKIKHMPVTVLKIDRSFIEDIFADQNDKAIVNAILVMAKQLQLRVVAEGVETYEQLEFLRANGCDLIQGYIYSRPVPAEAFLELWKNGMLEPKV